MLIIWIFAGEVIVQRLNLQVLWTQPAPYEDAKVCGIGWRPDERILAIGKELCTSFLMNFPVNFLIAKPSICEKFQISRLQQWKGHSSRR